MPTRGWNGINRFELMLLHLLGKKVFVYTYGADVRTQEKTIGLGKYNCCMHCPDVGNSCVCNEKKHRKNVIKIQRYATDLLSMGDMVEYTPESDTSLFFWPIDVRNVSYVGTPDEDDSPIKIVHAPNHRHYKGTNYLIDTVESLQKEGLPLELVMVENIANDEAMEIYEDGDIIAEQFLIGWHGFMAIEAMALGKPVISYIRKGSYILNPHECPIVSANPDNLKDVIRNLAKNPYKRRELGKRGREYVEKYFSLEAFSERLAKLYQKHGILA